MGHIGNTVQTAFTSFDKQTITGTGTAVYTLSHSVANEQEIEVFVNNVRQEGGSGKAFTVSGNQITFSENIASTDTVYVNFAGKAVQTVAHPSDAPLQATTGTFSGDLTVDTDTLYVDSTNNRVGIGNAAPATALDVSGSASVTSFTGTSRLGITARGSSSTNDYSGIDIIGGALTTPVARIASLTTGAGSTLSFGTSNSYASGITNTAMTIDSSGTTSFHGISGRASGSTGHMSISEQGDNRSYVELATTSTSNKGLMAFWNPNGVVGTITVSGSSTSYNTSSDYRLKENVTATWDATTRLKQLNPVRFNFISDADTTVDGFLAHEVQSVVPEAISGTKDEVDDDGNPVYQGIDQSKLVPLLVKTIQELEARVAALENA